MEKKSIFAIGADCGVKRQDECTEPLGSGVKSEGINDEGVEEENGGLDEHLSGVEDCPEKEEFETLIEGTKESAN